MHHEGDAPNLPATRFTIDLIGPRSVGKSQVAIEHEIQEKRRPDDKIKSSGRSGRIPKWIRVESL